MARVLDAVDIYGSERQGPALARCPLADFWVLVLDEPTEHVQERTASALLDGLLASNDRRTVLLITHRDVASERLDRVLDVRAGRLSRV